MTVKMTVNGFLIFKNSKIQIFKIHEFSYNVQIPIVIVNLSCKNNSAWCFNVKHSLEHDLKWLESKAISQCVFSWNLNFWNSKNTVNGLISTVIVNLSCEIDRGWFSGVKRCVEHDLKLFRSKIMYLCVFMSTLQSVQSLRVTFRYVESWCQNL